MRALLVLACLVCAAAATEVTIDLLAQGTPFPHYWKRSVGSGHMLLGTRSDWQQHMLRARNELGFTGVRGHGILDDDMSVIIDGQYHFYNVDQVYDFLLSIGVRPIVELSFMPRALVNCAPNECEYAFGDPPGAYKGLVMPPKNFNQWYMLVKALVQHVVDRYGLEEVSQWDFEVWNELWGMEFPKDYMALYNASALAVKAVHPSLRVGGPATMQVQYVNEFIANAHAAGLPVDFVSTHFYPSDPNCTDTPQEKKDIDCFAETILKGCRAAHAAGLPFYLTEYNDGLEDGTHRDNAYAAGFVIHNIPLLTELNMFSWWTFTDIFEEQGLKAFPFSNAFGLQNIYGVAKPVYRAFQTLNDAGDTLVNVSVASAGDTAVTAFATVLSTSPQEPFAALKLYATNFRRNEIPISGETVTFTIKHAAGANVPASAAVALIDSKNCNPRGLWESWGSPMYPTAAQIDQLKAASQLVEVSVPVTSTSPITVSFQVQLEAYAVAYVHF